MIRVLTSTVAFGMGVDIPDVRFIVHWGKVKSLMLLWQEIGMAGRDGQQSKAIWFPKSTVGDDMEILDSLEKDSSTCIRLAILRHF